MSGPRRNSKRNEKAKERKGEKMRGNGVERRGTHIRTAVWGEMVSDKIKPQRRKKARMK